VNCMILWGVELTARDAEYQGNLLREVL